MARIDPVTQEISRKEAELQLEQLISQDRGRCAARPESFSRKPKSRVSKPWRVLEPSRSTILAQRQQELSSLEDSLAARDGHVNNRSSSSRPVSMPATKRSIDRPDQGTNSGCVIDRNVHAAKWCNPAALVHIGSGTQETNLESLAFFSPGDGKRLKAGQRVRITPSSTKQQRHGGLKGSDHIRRLPVNDQALVKRLGLESLLDAARTEPKAPLIEVKTSMKLDPRTVSGYDWGGPGPDEITQAPQLKFVCSWRSGARSVT